MAWLTEKYRTHPHCTLAIYNAVRISFDLLKEEDVCTDDDEFGGIPIQNDRYTVILVLTRIPLFFHILLS